MGVRRAADASGLLGALPNQGGSYRKPRFLGERRVAARVLADSYGSAKQQHTFTLLVIESDGYEALPDEEPADVLTGIVYSADAETVLAEIDWIDTPRPGEVTQLLEAAADAVDRS